MFLNQHITRINSGNDTGNTGKIIEIKGGRARIEWDHKRPRTWIRFDFLKPEPFTVHGIYTVSNHGGYEIEISREGESARVRDAFGGSNPKMSNWLPIVDVSDDGDGKLVIDPKGYNIPLSEVMIHG